MKEAREHPWKLSRLFWVLSTSAILAFLWQAVRVSVSEITQAVPTVALQTQPLPSPSLAAGPLCSVESSFSYSPLHPKARPRQQRKDCKSVGDKENTLSDHAKGLLLNRCCWQWIWNWFTSLKGEIQHHLKTRVSGAGSWPWLRCSGVLQRTGV